jgi:hypothetical protein
MSDNIHSFTTDGKSSSVSLETLSKMTGFPVELIKEELFDGSSSDQVCLESLRAAMLSYIDSTLLMQDEEHCPTIEIK